MTKGRRDKDAEIKMLWEDLSGRERQSEDEERQNLGILDLINQKEWDYGLGDARYWSQTVIEGEVWHQVVGGLVLGEFWRQIVVEFVSQIAGEVWNQSVGEVIFRWVLKSNCNWVC